MDRKYWLGLVNALLVGAAGGIVAVIVDAEHFNLVERWRDLVGVCLALALVSGAQYVRNPERRDNRLSSALDKIAADIK